MALCITRVQSSLVVLTMGSTLVIVSNVVLSGDLYRGGSAVRIFLRYGLGVCLWIVGFMGVVGTLATLVSEKREGFQEPLLAFAIFGGSCGLLYFLYRYIGSRWYDMTDTTRTLITLVCFAIFAGTGIFGWSARRAFFIIAIIILGVVGVIAFFARGGPSFGWAEGSGSGKGRRPTRDKQRAE